MVLRPADTGQARAHTGQTLPTGQAAHVTDLPLERRVSGGSAARALEEDDTPPLAEAGPPALVIHVGPARARTTARVARLLVQTIRLFSSFGTLKVASHKSNTCMSIM